MFLFITVTQQAYVSAWSKPSKNDHSGLHIITYCIVHCTIKCMHIKLALKATTQCVLYITGHLILLLFL